MKRILLGEETERYWEVLDSNDYKSEDPNVKGEVFEDVPYQGRQTFFGFWCASHIETYCESFNDPVEAMKYADGIVAKTIDGNMI